MSLERIASWVVNGFSRGERFPSLGWYRVRAEHNLTSWSNRICEAEDSKDLLRCLPGLQWPFTSGEEIGSDFAQNGIALSDFGCHQHLPSALASVSIQAVC